MARIMKTIAACSTAAALLASAAYVHFRPDWLLSVAITLGTIAYHFDMRLLMDGIVDAAMRNRADYRKPRYQPLPFEEKLYRRLKIWKWKGKLPTYSPELFSMQRPLADVIQAMCQAETVHEIILPLSFLPVIAAIPFGSLPVFLITSILAACVDLLFIIAQRYNRPRLVRLMERMQNRK